MIKALWSPKTSSLFWGSGLASSWCFGFLCELIVEVWPRRACGLAVCMGTREGLESPRVLVGTPCRCCGTEWSGGIDFSENPSSVEGGDVEQVCSNLETNIPCLRLLSLSLTCLYLTCLYCFHFYMLDILCAYCHMLGDCLLTLVFNQESQRGTSTLI